MIGLKLQSSTPRSWFLLCSLAGMLAFGGSVWAHPVPAAKALLDLQDSGRWELSITCDVSALVMQTTPGHLDAAATELQALSEEELAARVDDARQAVEYYLELKFDGAKTKLPTIEMPAIDTIRKGAVHGGEDTWPEILMQGSWPIEAETCEITFPAALGRVKFTLVQQEEIFFSHELAAGKPSGLIPLADSAEPQVVRREDLTGWIMVGLLLAYLVWLFLNRPRYDAEFYSRSTNTGQ